MVLTMTESNYLKITVFYSDTAVIIIAIGILIIAISSSLQS